MKPRLKRRLAIVATAALSVAALPSVLGSAGADAPVMVPAGTTVERDITIELPTVAPAEVVLLVDATGSEYRSLGPAVDRIVSAAEAAGAPLRIAVASVGDYPVRPFGVAGDAPYTLLQPLSGDPARWSEVLDGLEARRVGGDPAEGQVGALAEAIQDAAVGFSPDATKLAIVVSDAPAHDGDDVGCDANGACADYPGPMATDVADLAEASGVQLVSLGTAHDDALRTIAPVIGPVHDGADPLVALFLPSQLAVSPVTTCEADVEVTYEPATVVGLPGAAVTVRQTITAGAEVDGAVTCLGGPVDGLDLVVDTTVVTVTEIDTLTDPTDPIGDDTAPAETAPDEAAESDDATDPETEPTPAETVPDDASETDDAADPETAPEPVVATVTIPIDGAPFQLDLSMPEERQQALLTGGAVIVETSGSFPANGFDPDLTADLTEEPLGGVVVPDPEQPLLWEYQPVGPGTDVLEYRLSDSDQTVVATIIVEFVVAEPDEGTPDAEVVEPTDEADATETEPAEDETPAADPPPSDDPAPNDGETDPADQPSDDAPEPDADQSAPQGDGEDAPETPTEEQPPPTEDSGTVTTSQADTGAEG